MSPPKADPPWADLLLIPYSLFTTQGVGYRGIPLSSTRRSFSEGGLRHAVALAKAVFDTP